MIKRTRLPKTLAPLALLVCSWIFSTATLAHSPGPYFGLFGGYGSARSTELVQQGAVLLNPVQHLPIRAAGPTSRSNLGMGGLQLGYEWARLGSREHDWGIKPALELEAIYLGKHSPVGDMPVRPAALGTQYVTLPMTAGVILANAVFTLETPYSSKVFPYVGVGVGAARLSIKNADSFNPSEPGINHFNSDPNASSTELALQLKVGLKATVSEQIQMFAEYRHLSINSSSYTFGATDYPGLHLPTRPWDVSLGRQKYNFFVVGLQYRF